VKEAKVMMQLLKKT